MVWYLIVTCGLLLGYRFVVWLIVSSFVAGVGLVLIVDGGWVYVVGCSFLCL